MPRRRRRRGKYRSTSGGPTEEALRRDQVLAEFWTDRIKAAKAVKEDYVGTAKEVLGFLKSQHKVFYDGLSASGFINTDAGFMGVSVPKVAQMMGSLGPRLHVVKPDRNVHSLGTDGVGRALAKVLGAYLNYTGRESKFAPQLRRAIDDGLSAGRMALRQEWDEVRGIIASRHLDSLDLLFDPDFYELNDGYWIAVRHREPLWLLRRRVPKWRLEGLDDSGTPLGVDEDGEDRPDDDLDEVQRERPTATVVEWWEVLSKMGAGFRGTHRVDRGEEARGFEDGKDHVRLEVVIGHDKLLAENEWPVPLYLDREWPISVKDLVETPRSHWPESPAGQVLSLQKAADLLTSLRLSSCKNRDRVVVFASKELDVGAQETLRAGSSADFIPVQLPPGQSLDSVMKVAEFGQGSQESVLERDFYLQQMDTVMGTTAFTTGGQDPGGVDRSATASQFRNAGSEVRVAALEARVSELMEDAARKEAISVRLFLDEEDVAPFVRPDDVAMFYVRIEVPGKAEVPVRPASFKPQEGEADVEQPLTLVDIYPGAATYFDSPMEAIKAAEGAWLSLLTEQTDLRLIAFRDQVAQGGLDPATGLPLAFGVAPVTVEQVWRDTAGLTPQELARELSYEVVAGKGVKFDRRAEQAAIDMQLQTLLPVLVQAGDAAGVNKMIGLWQDAYEVPPDKRVSITIPPPAPPQGDGGGEEGEEPKGGEE